MSSSTLLVAVTHPFLLLSSIPRYKTLCHFQLLFELPWILLCSVCSLESFGLFNKTLKVPYLSKLHFYTHLHLTQLLPTTRDFSANEYDWLRNETWPVIVKMAESVVDPVMGSTQDTIRVGKTCSLAVKVSNQLPFSRRFHHTFFFAGVVFGQIFSKTGNLTPLNSKLSF